MLLIEVVWDRPTGVERLHLALAAGATVAAALAAAQSQWQHAAQTAEWQGVTTGIFGEIVGLERTLQDGDRLELYRALLVDPRLARRARVQRQRAARGR